MDSRRGWRDPPPGCRRAAGTPIGANDLWIANHALTEDCTLVTNHLREFKRVAGLKLENWAHDAVPPSSG